MTKKIIIISILFTTLSAVLFGGTFFEDEKKATDPFVGDFGGFGSLFVNPAGAAGQTGSELSVSFGVRTTMNDVKLIMSLKDMATAMASTEGLTEESLADVGTTLSDLYDSNVINDDLLNSLFDGTDLDPDTIDWSDPSAVQAAAEALDSTDIAAIETQVEGIMDGTNTDFYSALDSTVGEVDMTALAGFKTGFLIKGWGMGIYDQAMGVAYIDPSSTTYGLKTIYNELGVIAGGGFTVLDGKLAFGVSANYGLLMQASDIAFEDFNTLIDGSINYGYSWGVDLGAIWRPAPSLGIGVVFNDVIGWTEADTPRTAAGLLGLLDEGAYLMNDFGYKFTMDVDAGITWHPDWRFVEPQFSVDLYNLIGYGRDIADEGDDFKAAMYRSLEHMRVGMGFTFFDFFKLRGQYFNHYLSVGVGLDLLFLELYGELKVEDQAVKADSLGDVPIGGDVVIRIHL